MRDVPHPLTVITANAPDGRLTGLLVSSFSTVTIHPDPHVSFNIKLPSSTYEEIARTGRFSSTIIWSVQTARSFLRRKDRPSVLSSEAVSGGQNHTGLLDGSIFTLECKWLEKKSVQVGDHVIMVGRVTEYTKGPTSEASRGPLMYRDGRYVNASSLKPQEDEEDSRNSSR